MNKKFFDISGFEKCLHPKKSRFGSFYSVKTTYFAFSCFFKKHVSELKFSLRERFWIEKNTTHQILNLKKTRHILNLEKYNASYFEFRKIKRVRFRVKNNTTCQILSVLLLQLAKFWFIHQDRACFGDVLMYGLGSISQVILLGSALCTPTVINVRRRIKTANTMQVGSSIYVDMECYLTGFF